MVAKVTGWKNICCCFSTHNAIRTPTMYTDRFEHFWWVVSNLNLVCTCVACFKKHTTKEILCVSGRPSTVRSESKLPQRTSAHKSCRVEVSDGLSLRWAESTLGFRQSQHCRVSPTFLRIWSEGHPIGFPSTFSQCWAILCSSLHSIWLLKVLMVFSSHVRYRIWQVAECAEDVCWQSRRFADGAWSWSTLLDTE